MSLPAELAQHLAVLGTATGDELQATVEALLSATIRAVPTCLAVSVTLSRDGGHVTVAATVPGTLPATVEVQSSLAVQLPGTAAQLTIQAASPGALQLVVADLIALLDLDPRRVILDAHLTVPTAGAVPGALASEVIVNRALGVLLEREGLLPEEGRALLVRLAAESGTTVPAVAAVVLGW